MKPERGDSQSESVSADLQQLISQKIRNSSSTGPRNWKSCRGSWEMQYIPMYFLLESQNSCKTAGEKQKSSTVHCISAPSCLSHDVMIWNTDRTRAASKSKLSENHHGTTAALHMHEPLLAERMVSRIPCRAFG